MKVLAVLSVLLGVIITDAAYLTEHQYQREFSSFIKSYNKAYQTNDFFNRYEIFKINLDLINSQSGVKSTMGMFANKMAGLIVPNSQSGKFHPVKQTISQSINQSINYPIQPVNNAPASLDWRNKGAVTAVKDQGSCSSSWAFSAAGAIEGAWFVARNELVTMSTQQLMDCSDEQGNKSCQGGYMENAFEFVKTNEGICSEYAYPYLGKDSTCNTECRSIASINSYSRIDYVVDDSALMLAIQNGPISVAIQASSPVFQMYTGGVISGAACGARVDHGVLLVEYGTDPQMGDFWIVKNSYSQQWGEKGYVRLARGQNECGINSHASQPLVD